MRDKRVRRDIEGLLAKVRILLERIYGNRLVDIVLFGSFSRDRAREDSDIDIAVVLKGNVETIKEIGRISSLLKELLEKHRGKLEEIKVDASEFNEEFALDKGGEDEKDEEE